MLFVVWRVSVYCLGFLFVFFFSSRRRHTRWTGDWSSDVCSSDLFTFLSCPGLEATNWRAEQAIRPMVVTRKVWGGNRTSRGAHTQGILVSILQTCRQQLRSASSILQKLICASQPKPLDLTVHTR